MRPAAQHGPCGAMLSHPNLPPCDSYHIAFHRAAHTQHKSSDFDLSIKQFDVSFLFVLLSRAWKDAKKASFGAWFVGSLPNTKLVQLIEQPVRRLCGHSQAPTPLSCFALAGSSSAS